MAAKMINVGKYRAGNCVTMRLSETLFALVRVASILSAIAIQAEYSAFRVWCLVSTRV